MDQNIRAKLQISTFFYFLIIIVLTTLSQLATMAIIVFGDISGKELLVAATVFVSGFIDDFVPIIANRIEDKLKKKSYINGAIPISSPYNHSN